MSVFTREDVNALFSLVPLVFWQLYNPPINISYGHAYEFERKKHFIRIALPARYFPFGWALVYGLIVASGFMYFRDYQEDNQYYLATTIIYLINVMLNKYWSIFFFRGTTTSRRYALLIIVVLLITSTTIVFLQYVTNALIPATLYGVYLLWILYALLLNIKWLKIPPYVPGKIVPTPGYKSKRPTRELPKKLPQIHRSNIPRFVSEK